MSLSTATLKSSLLTLLDPTNANFAGYPATATAGAANFANAYDAYAQSATDVTGDGFLVGPSKSGFQSAIVNAFATQTAAALSAGFDAAFAAYWGSVAFKAVTVPLDTAPGTRSGGSKTFSAKTSSVVTAPTVGALTSTFLAEFQNPLSSADANAKATNLANVLATATAGLVVVITGLDRTTPTAVTTTLTYTVV